MPYLDDLVQRFVDHCFDPSFLFVGQRYFVWVFKYDIHIGAYLGEYPADIIDSPCRVIMSQFVAAPSSDLFILHPCFPFEINAAAQVIVL